MMPKNLFHAKAHGKLTSKERDELRTNMDCLSDEAAFCTATMRAGQCVGRRARVIAFAEQNSDTKDGATLAASGWALLSQPAICSGAQFNLSLLAGEPGNQPECGYDGYRAFLADDKAWHRPKLSWEVCKGRLTCVKVGRTSKDMLC